jgi:Fe-S cluster biogenesis protein NfuA
MIDITLKDGIEELIINEIPEVKEVVNVDISGD